VREAESKRRTVSKRRTPKELANREEPRTDGLGPDDRRESRSRGNEDVERGTRDDR
jgi:hypothetical protein